jgi:hypothetical protein
MGLTSRAVAVGGETQNLHFVNTIDKYDATELKSGDHNTTK